MDIVGSSGVNLSTSTPVKTCKPVKLVKIGFMFYNDVIIDNHGTIIL